MRLRAGGMHCIRNIYMRDNVVGIYQITNMINGKAYVGQSWNIARRFGDYRWGGSCNRHLRSAFTKYGIGAFMFEIIHALPMAISQSTMDSVEQHYIDSMCLLDSKCGYNIRQAGSHGRHSEETRKRISKLHRGKKLSDEHKRHIGEKSKGRFYSAETRAKIGAAHIGMTFSDEALHKMRESHLGKKLSRESIEKRTRTRQSKGEWFSEEHKQNISDALKKAWKTNPIHQSKEWRAKISKTLKGRPWSAARRAAQEQRKERLNG